MRASRLLAMAGLVAASVMGGCAQPAGPPAPAPLLNQVGYLPGAAKWAVLPEGPAGQSFVIVEADGGREVLRGRAGGAAYWEPAGQSVQLADFSVLSQPGLYRLRLAGGGESAPFRIDHQAYAALNAAAIKAYYFNRSGIELLPRHAGPYARPAGTPDTAVRVHASGATPQRPEGTLIDGSKGWYDAGDYNKYVVNSGITMGTLLAAWEHFPAQFEHQVLNLPESGNGLPDLLNELLWNLDWMLAMQDPHDGGVHHKLTSPRFDGMVMPHLASSERVVVAKGTAATLDFAAVTAMASRVMQRFEGARPGYAARLRAAAQAAWQWAVRHPDVPYRQPSDIRTGEYGDSRFDDEFAWAAAELYITTRDEAYRRALPLDSLSIGVPGWSDVKGLAWMSLAQHRQALAPQIAAALVARRITGLAEDLAASWQASPWRVALQTRDFVWGSNAVALNQALMLLQGYRISGDRRQLDAAQAALDWVLGRNALGLSMVTGFGQRSPWHPHHRPSQADGVVAPVPGFLVGGPNPGQQDAARCSMPYPSKWPALSYLDDVCSYASNEVAINWNAPLVYVSAALQALTPPPRQP